MELSREPVLRPTKITSLRPGQLTVGFQEVQTKRQAWKIKDEEKREKHLGKHVIPIIRGPKPKTGKGEKEKSRIRVIHDNHHFTRALFEEGIEDIFTIIGIDLGHLQEEEFWYFLDSSKGLIHPFAENGERRHYSELPKTIADLTDDPYRSLAWETRRRGGYAKDASSFSEFLWADFFRRRIQRLLVKRDFKQAASEAYALARSKEANHLPGWCGPVTD